MNVVATNEQNITTCALLDEGSHRSFITESLARKLGIVVSGYETISLATFSAECVGTRTLAKSSVQIRTSDGLIELPVLIIPSISPPIQNRNISELMAFEHLKNLTLAPHPGSEKIIIGVLIGADAYWNFVGDKIIRGHTGPTAVSSNLGGFLVSGPTSDSLHSSLTFVYNILTNESPTCSMDMTQYWDLESLGISSTESTDMGNFDVHNFAASKIHFRGDHYAVGFPWKTEHDPLPTNFVATNARTRAMINKLSDAELAEYDSLIQDQLRKRFIEPVSIFDTTRGHYLPHYGVRKESSSTPLRIVYCCNAKGKHSPSLNDCLEQGPLLLQDLTAILLRFRIPEVAFTADIEKAFLNIELQDEDREFTKFLWLSDPTDRNSPFQELQFRTVLFGATCSPFLLNLVILRHLQTYGNQPIASNLQANIYVDNLLSGCPATEAVSYYKQAVRILDRAGFNLRAWSSNSGDLVNQAQHDGRLATEHDVNILGLQWQPKSDVISCRPLPPVQSTSPTKRQILSSASKLYDIFGYLAPVHVKLKLLLQHLHLSNIGWDDPLPNDVTTQWHQLYHELQQASALVNWPRRISGLTKSTRVTLHGFGDSSLAAYGACVYIAADNGTTLIMARSRLAPKPRELTLPRLELLGALLCTKLLTFVWTHLQHSLNITNVILWSDSQITLSWIKSSKKLPTFVENRCKVIRESVISDFRYCPTASNPADLLTRGAKCDQLLNSHPWWHGPDWLNDGDWPVPPEPNTAILLAPTVDRQQAPADQQTAPDTNSPRIDVSKVIDLDRFSSMDKLLKCTAYVLRVFDKNRVSGHLTAQELRNAKNHWLYAVQSASFKCEQLFLLKKSKTCGPLVNQLKLFIDPTDGLIRKGGRLENANLAYNCKYPILLPAKHRFTWLVIHRAHADVLHQGRQATTLHIRRSYWITQIHTAVKTYVYRCVTCKKVQGRPYRTPITPPLQKWRVSQTAPFSVTGVDYTGEIWVTENGERRKVYICLFTCAVCRAIHLELVNDGSCEGFLLAFRRFVARRSLPSKMVSDNASCLTSAATELTKLFKSEKLQQAIAEKGIEWYFIPKRSPWHGGFWERMIGLVKNALRKVLGRATVSANELNTLLTEVEASINDRPLTDMCTEPGLPTPLTPSQLINSRLITPLPYETPDLEDPAWFPNNERESLLTRHTKLSQLYDQFWSRFQSDYLPALRDKHAWGKNSEITVDKIKVDDIVLVHNDTKKRPLWKTAVITKLITSNDGLVRAAEIRTPSGVANRAIAKLYPLEISHDSNDQMDRVENHIPISDNSDSENDTAGVVTAIRPRRKAAIEAAEKIHRIAQDN